MTRGSRRPAARVLRIALFAIAGIAVAFALVYAFRGALFGRIAAEKIASILTAELGGRFTVESVEGDVFHDLSLVGVRAAESAPAPVSRLEIGRVRVTYPFLAILRDDPLRHLRSLTVSGLDLDIDLTQQRPPSDPRPFRLPLDLPELSISGKASVRTVDGTFRSGHVELRGSGRSFSLLLDPLESPDAWGLAPARIEGRIDRPSADTIAWSSSSSLAGAELRALRLVMGDRGEAKLFFDLGVAGGKVSGSLDDQAIDFAIESLDMARLPPWVRAMPRDPHVIPAQGTLASAGVITSWRTIGRALRADVVARDVLWAGVPVASLRASGGWAGRRILVETLEAGVGGAEVAAEHVALDLDDPLVVAAARSARARGPDAARFAAALRLAGPDTLPAGFSFSLEAQREDRGPLRVSKLAAEDAEISFEASGTLQPGPRWSAWREFPLTASVRGRSKAPQVRVIREQVEARADEISVSGEVQGLLGRPSGSFEIDAKSLRLANEPVDRVSAAGTLAWPLVTLSRLDVYLPDGSLKAAGTIDLEAHEIRNATFEARLRRFYLLHRVVSDLRSIEGELEASGTIERARIDEAYAVLNLTGRDVRAGSYAVGTVNAGLRMAGREIVVERAGAVGLHGEMDAKGTLALDREGKAAIDLAIEARVPDVSRLADLSDAFRRAQGAARIEGRLTRAAGASRASFTGKLAATGVEVDGWRIGAISSAAKLEGTVLELSAIDVNGPSGRATGEARVDVASGAIERAAFDVDSSVDAAVIHRGAGSPAVRGLVRVQGRVEKLEGSGWKAWRGDVRLLADAFEVSGQAFRDVRARLVAAGGEIRVEDLRARHATAAVEARGAVVPEDGGARVRVEALKTILEDGRAFELQRPAEVRWRPGSLVVESFEIAGAEGRLAGRGSFGERLDVEIEASALDLAAVVPNAKGRIDAQLTASGPREAPAFSGRIRAPALAWGARRVSLEASFRQADGVLVVETLDVDAGDLLTLQGGGRLPTVAWIDGRPAFGRVEDAAFTLHGTTSGAATWTELGIVQPSRLSDLEVDLEAKGREMSVRARGQLLVRREREDREARQVPVSVDARFAPDGARLDFIAGTAEAPLASAILNSALEYDWTNLARWMDRGGSLELDGRLDVEAADAAPLAPFFPELRHLGGQAKLHAEVRGTVAEPVFSGTAELDGVSIRFEADVPGVDDLVARLRLEGREVVIDRLEGKSGYSPFAIRGRARLESLRQPVLDVSVEGRNFLVARDDALRLRADLDTSIKGPLDAMKVTGKARVTDALWSQAMDLAGGTAGPPAGGDRADRLFRFRGYPFSTATFDLEVTADKSIRVDNNLVHAVLSARLMLVGSGEAPRLEGRIFTERAFVRLPFTRLDIERAEIQFRQQDDYRPRLDAVAWTRLKGYELTVHVGGVLPTTEVKVASLPPLSQRDAYLLLTTGITPTELAREGITRAALHRAGSVYGTELLSQFSSAKDQNPLERFSLDIGRDESEDGMPTIDLEAPLSQRFFLHMQRDRFDDYNAGIIWRLRLK